MQVYCVLAPSCASIIPALLSSLPVCMLLLQKYRMRLLWEEGIVTVRGRWKMMQMKKGRPRTLAQPAPTSLASRYMYIYVAANPLPKQACKGWYEIHTPYKAALPSPISVSLVSRLLWGAEKMAWYRLFVHVHESC